MRTERVKNHLSDLRLILGIGALYTLLQVVTLLRLFVQLRIDGFHPDLGVLIQERALALVVALLFIVIIVKTTRLFVTENVAWPKIIALHLLFALLVSLLWYSTFIALSYLLCPSGEDCLGSRQQLLFWYLINFDKIVLIYLFTVSLTYTYHYIKRDSVHQIQKSQIEKQLLRTRLQALQSQLHPHFLFNTLNSIASLIDIDNRRAQTMIADLGDLLRHVLDSRDVQFVTVREEVDLLTKYLDIEKTRFSDDLEVHLEVDPDVEGALAPSLLLQPIVENSIRHGYSRHTPHLRIDIRIGRQEDKLVLCVADNGRGLTADQAGASVFRRGTGLQNTRERLDSLYGARHAFRVENGHPGVRNYIELPLQFETRPAARPALP